MTIVLISALFTAFLPEEFVALNSKFKPNAAMRLLYGGITEEILMRYGLMTFVVWGLYKIFSKLHAAVYWAGILIAALVFAFGHLPVAFAAVAHPSATLLAYIILGNLPGGIIFGWLYWQKGLESAMLAHIFTHVVLLTAEQFIKV
jgi:membrane protease YdiL (CAAX protease family)